MQTQDSVSQENKRTFGHRFKNGTKLNQFAACLLKHGFVSLLNALSFSKCMSR